MYFNKNDISEITDVTAEELENAVNTLKEDNGLEGLGAYFIEAQDKYNINAIMLVAIACLESAYGTSKLAIEKNNLFGLRANDEYRDDPSKYGDYFSTKEDCIDYAGHKLRYQYLEEDEKAPWCYCNGETDIYSIGSIWCSNPEWGDYVVDLSTRLSKAIESERDSHIDYKAKYLKEKDKLDRIRAILNEDEIDTYNLEDEEEDEPSYEY